MPKSLVICLYTLMAFASFSLTSSLTGGGYIEGTLGGASELSYYSISFLALGNACTYPVARILAARFGDLQILCLFLSLFTLCTFLCGIAPTFVLFIIARFFCGVFSGIFISIALWMILAEKSESEKNNTWAFVALIFTLIPSLSSTLGGWVAYDLDWVWLFFAQIPILLIMGYILYKNKKPFNPPATIPPFDTVGYIFYLLTISSIVTAASLGQQLDWFRSPLICVLLAIFVICLPFLILWEKKCAFPIIPLSLLKNHLYNVALICLATLYSTYFGVIMLLSLWLHLDVNYTPIWIGLSLGSMCISCVILFFALKKWFAKVASLWVVLIAIFIFSLSCFYSTRFNVEIDPGRVLTSQIFAGTGLAFFFCPLLLATMKVLRTDQIASAITFFQVIRLLGAALGTSFYITLWIRRKVFYHERLGEDLTAYSNLTDEYFANLSLYGKTGLSAKETLGTALNKQADALALADCFSLMGWFMLITFILLAGHLFFSWLEKKREKKALTNTN